MLCACTHDSTAHDLRVGAFPCMVSDCRCKGLRLAAEDLRCTGLAAIIEPCRSCGAPRMDHDPLSGIPSKFCTGFKEPLPLPPVKITENDFLWRPPPKIVPPPHGPGQPTSCERRSKRTASR